MQFRCLFHYFVYVACCSVYITDATDWHFEGVNIAKGKPATQGPDTFSNYNASLAVDGNTSRKFDDGSCTHTNGLSSIEAYWKVDLQKAYKITGIVVYNREGYEERLKSYIIYGNDTEILHNSRGSNEYNQSVIHIPLEKEGRSFSSITVQLPANVGYSVGGWYYLTLCEVEIFTASCGHMNISNGYMKPNKTLYEFNTQVHIVCNEGYEPTMQNITCQNNKEWNNYIPCSRVFCAYPGKPLHGDYLQGNIENNAINVSSFLPYGSVIIVKCDLGYKNTKNRTCQGDGTWSGEAPVCIKVQCPYPERIINGEYQLQNGSAYRSGSSYYNTSVKVICNKGYKVNGTNERTCNSNQTWSGEQRTCVLVTCRQPEKLKDGFYNYTKTLLSEGAPYNTILTAGCDKDFNLVNPENRKRRCTETGVWDKEPALCDMLCTVPNVTNGQFINLVTSRFKIGTSLHFTCDQGFTPTTSKSDITCLKNRRWSGNPECEAKQETSTAALIGGLSSAVMLLVVVMISGLVVYRIRRRKRNSKHQEELMTYTNLGKKQDGLSNNDYQEINAMELEKGGSSKDNKVTERDYSVYSNATIEI